jgi:hypothetical protein
VLLALLLIAAPALSSENVAAAKTNYEKARYEDVVKALRDADFSALEKATMADALFMLGVSELALGNEALSQRALVRLFSEVPDFEWPLVAKKVVAALEKARKQVPVALSPATQSDGVRVCGTGLPKRAEVKIVFTTPSGEEGGLGTFDAGCFVRAAPREQNVTGYYVIASIDGEQRATVGSRLQPMPYEQKKKEQGPVAGEGGTPWYKHWLTWTIVGLVVAGGVTAGAVGGKLAADAAAPGTVRVTVKVP